MTNNNPSITVIVLGGGTNALGQIRAAHQAGYTCINVVEDNIHKYSAKSKYCKGYLSPHPFKQKEECVKFLTDIIKRLPSKPYLFSTGDDWMELVGENEAMFNEIAYNIQSNWEATSKLYNKKYLYRLALEHDIPHPRTVDLDSLKGIEPSLAKITFPCIIKPQLTVSQNDIADKKIKAYHRTQIFNRREDASKWTESMLGNGIDFPVLIQEYIPGDATTLYTLTSYSSADGTLIAGSIGHKLRQFPPVAGRITSGVLQYDRALHEVGEKFLKTIGYHGVANTEFKYDARDGQYKLIEINTRFGAWNYSALYSGINLLKIAVDDFNGKHYTGACFDTSCDGHIWYNILQDLGAVTILNKKAGYPEYCMSPSKWKKSLGNSHFEAVWDINDIMPFVYSIFNTIGGFFSKEIRA